MAKPIVDGIERELEGEASLVRLSVLSKVGAQAAQRFSVRSVPTLLVFDAKGQLVEQSVGFPDRNRIVSSVRELSQ
jgi:thioredoxin-like negative regulator of GroEL